VQRHGKLLFDFRQKLSRRHLPARFDPLPDKGQHFRLQLDRALGPRLFWEKTGASFFEKLFPQDVEGLTAHAELAADLDDTLVIHHVSTQHLVAYLEVVAGIEEIRIFPEQRRLDPFGGGIQEAGLREVADLGDRSFPHRMEHTIRAAVCQHVYTANCIISLVAYFSVAHIPYTKELGGFIILTLRSHSVDTFATPYPPQTLSDLWIEDT
jgi:hypothetical protein